MIKLLSSFILKISGWTCSSETLIDKKAVVIAVPHTSGWDFIWGKLAFMSLGIPTYILMKREYFKFPLGIILKALNVLPVNRGNRKSNLVPQLVEEFKMRDKMYLSITPEGSRKKRAKWKKGFYQIALAANVPIYLGRIDYGKKRCEVGERFVPTGDLEKDMKYVQTHYKDIVAKHPECFSWGKEIYGED